MKFRNPKTGEEFSTIFEALTAECVKYHTCEGCPLQSSNNSCMSCRVYAENHPDEAAQRLGLEVIEDGHTAHKPRVAELLGVEVGQKWRVVCPEEGVDSGEIWLNEKGYPINHPASYGIVLLCTALNHPESIIKSPHLAEPEIAVCKAIGAKWVSHDSTGDSVDLWLNKPVKHNGMFSIGDEDEEALAVIADILFPSVRPGDLIEVPERGITNA